MEKYNVRFKKKYGQNFLKDDNIVKKIVNIVLIKEKSLVVEVGPGGGILTKGLANNFDKVIAYEIDESLKDELEGRIHSFNNVEVLYKDFLKCDLVNDLNEYKEYSKYFISNVPYYITSPIIMKLIDSGIVFNKIVLMVQKEVGERYSSEPGNRSYGSISVILQYFYNINKEFIVGKNNFTPIPKVDSVVISLSPRNIYNKVKDVDKFIKVVHESFQYKRKTIKNNLKKYDLDLISIILDRYGFDLSCRAEMIPFDVFVDISNNI